MAMKYFQHEAHTEEEPKQRCKLARIQSVQPSSHISLLFTNEEQKKAGM